MLEITEHIYLHMLRMKLVSQLFKCDFTKYLLGYKGKMQTSRARNSKKICVERKYIFIFKDYWGRRIARSAIFVVVCLPLFFCPP